MALWFHILWKPALTHLKHSRMLGIVRFLVVVQGPASEIHHEIGFIGFLFVHLYLTLWWLKKSSAAAWIEHSSVQCVSKQCVQWCGACECVSVWPTYWVRWYRHVNISLQHTDIFRLDVYKVVCVLLRFEILQWVFCLLRTCAGGCFCVRVSVCCTLCSY